MLDTNGSDDAIPAGVDALSTKVGSRSDRDCGCVGGGDSLGRPHGKLPYGFARQYEVVGGKRRLVKQVVDREQAAVIRDAARRILEGEAPYAIARDFNARGIPSPRGGSWDLTQVKRIVISATVAGQRIHRGRVIGPGDWPAILDQKTWARCLTRLTDPDRRSGDDNPQVKYLLTGIATCGICSAGLKTVKNRGTRTYSCPNCFKVAIKVDTLDEYVTRLAVARLQRPDIIERMARADANPASAPATEHVHGTGCEQHRVGWSARAATDTVIRSKRAESRASTTPSIDMTGAMAGAAVLSPLPLSVAGPDAAARWETLTIHERRQLVAWLMAVTVDPIGRGKRFDPARLHHSRWRGDPLTWAEYT